jgi:hypothetical protein
MPHSLDCLACGRTFIATRRHALTCSGSCRVRRHAQRRAALTADLSALAREGVALKLAA